MSHRIECDADGDTIEFTSPTVISLVSASDKEHPKHFENLECLAIWVADEIKREVDARNLEREATDNRVGKLITASPGDTAAITSDKVRLEGER